MKGMIVKMSNNERNQNNQQKQIKSKSSVGSTLLIIFLIAVIMVTSSIGLYAWAKYTSSISGNATAQVAKWSFKLVDGVTETSDVIEFAFTRTDGYEHVVEGRLAPGTFGEFEIGIDARGTETILEYVIDVELENKPTYLKFYKDEARTQEISVADGEFSVKGFMSLDDVKEIRTETIYWDWPYENGDDVTDTNDAGKLVTMQVSVTGYEVLEQSAEDEETLVTLADVVEVGDYVNYDASSNGVKTFTSGDCLAGSNISGTISTADDFNSEAPAQWRVLSVDEESGLVELMAADPTVQTVTLSGGDGFVNAETVLNNVGAIYGQGEGAVGGRSITVEDIDQYSSYDKTTYKSEYSSTGYYGGIREYTSGNFYKEIKDENGNVTGYETTTTIASSSSPVKMTDTYYNYGSSSYFSNSTIYNMIFKNSTSISSNKSFYWLASRCVKLWSSDCSFIMQFVCGAVGVGTVYSSTGSTGNGTWGVVPVVSLKSNIQTTGKDSSGVWQLKID